MQLKTAVFSRPSPPGNITRRVVVAMFLVSGFLVNFIALPFSLYSYFRRSSKNYVALREWWGVGSGEWGVGSMVGVQFPHLPRALLSRLGLVA